MCAQDAQRWLRQTMANLIRKHNDIWEWHNVLENPEQLVASIPDKEWQYYTNKGGGETIIGRSHFIQEGTALHKDIMKLFFKCIYDYCKRNALSFTDEHVGQSPLILREYNTGSKMFEHSDIYSYVKKDGQHVTPSLTAILYINEDYSGGEIDFVHDDICVKPKAGSMFVFPSDKQHAVLEITSGDRYMIQTYVYPRPVSYYDK
jgi:hypothetical protein